MLAEPVRESCRLQSLRGWSHVKHIVTAVGRDGSCVEARVDHALGSPESPLGDAALIEKFNDCVSHAASPIDPALLARTSWISTR
jgi:hypothetical protein